ncbi:hypothetical protein CapIbe_013827 [Capra ibex]
MSDPRSTSLEMRRQAAKNREPGEGHSRQVRTQRPSSLYRRHFLAPPSTGCWVFLKNHVPMVIELMSSLEMDTQLC